MAGWTSALLPSILSQETQGHPKQALSSEELVHSERGLPGSRAAPGLAAVALSVWEKNLLPAHLPSFHFPHVGIIVHLHPSPTVPGLQGSEGLRVCRWPVPLWSWFFCSGLDR